MESHACLDQTSSKLALFLDFSVEIETMLAWLPTMCLGLAWLPTVCLGLAWLPTVCLGLAWLPTVCLGLAWLPTMCLGLEVQICGMFCLPTDSGCHQLKPLLTGCILAGKTNQLAGREGVN